MSKSKKKNPKPGDTLYLPETKERVILIEPKENEGKTFIDSCHEYEDDDPRESNPIVRTKQRWVVDVVERDVGDKIKLFRTVRNISWSLGNYYRLVATEEGDIILRRRLN